MFFSLSLIVNACFAGQGSRAGEDETRPTSGVSQSPLSAPLARFTNLKNAALPVQADTAADFAPHD
jgi:hypothetical protein